MFPAWFSFRRREQVYFSSESAAYPWALWPLSQRKGVPFRRVRPDSLRNHKASADKGNWGFYRPRCLSPCRIWCRGIQCRYIRRKSRAAGSKGTGNDSYLPSRFHGGVDGWLPLFGGCRRYARQVDDQRLDLAYFADCCTRSFRTYRRLSSRNRRKLPHRKRRHFCFWSLWISGLLPLFSVQMSP